MRILLHDYAGHPFQAELARALARRGHRVEHAHCSSYVSGKGQLERQQDDPTGLTFVTVPLNSEFAKYQVRRRITQELRYARRFIRHARRDPWDVVVMCNTPLIAHFVIALWLAGTRRRTVFWHQDVYSQALAGAMGKRFGAVARPFATVVNRMEQLIARFADHVVVIADTFVPVHRKWGTDPQRLTVQPNWAPLGDLPVRDRIDNPFAQRHDLVERPVVLYSGTVGFKHDVTLFGRLYAALVEQVPELAMVVVSEGEAADFLRANHPEFVVLPFQPFSALPDVLGTADVLLTILEQSASDFSVPSKTLSYLCAGRPVLALLPATNPAYGIVEQAGGLAFDVAHVDLADVATEVARVLTSPSVAAARGRAARAYADTHFDIEGICTTFEQLLTDAAAGRVQPSSPV